MGTIPASENVFPLLRMAEVAAPSTPPTGEAHLYVKADGLLYWKDDAGNEYAVGTGDTAAHLADATDAHDGSAISADTTGYGNSAATDVQGVLDDFDAAITAGGGGGAADDTIPSGGTLYAGSAGSTTGWTTGQSPTTFDADTTLPDMFLLQKTTMGAGNLVTARRNVGGSFPRSYRMRVGAGRLYQDFQGFAIMVGEAAPGKYLTWGPLRDGGNRYLQRTLWTNDTTAAGQTNMPGTGDVADRSSRDLWLGLDVNSSTDIDFLYSVDGYLYHEYITAYNPSFTVGTFGFAIFAFAAVQAGVGVRWIHET